MADMKCPSCGAAIPDGVTKCPACGKEISAPGSSPSKGDSEHLSQQQISELMAGGAVDITSSPAKETEEKPAEPKTETVSAPEPEKTDSGAYSPDLDEANFDSLMNFAAGSNKVADEIANEEVPPDFDNMPAEVMKREEREMPQIIIIIAIAVVAIVLGFLSCLLINGKLIKTGEQAFAEQAADAMQSTLGDKQQFVVFEAYSRIRAGKSECIIFGGVKTGFGTMENHLYRVLVENENPSVIRVFYEFDEEQYNQLKDSNDSTDRIQASVLKNYADEFDREVAEIRNGTGGWTKADAGDINKIIEDSPAPNGNVTEEVATQSYSEPDDVEDVYE